MKKYLPAACCLLAAAVTSALYFSIPKRLFYLLLLTVLFAVLGVFFVLKRLSKSDKPRVARIFRILLAVYLLSIAGFAVWFVAVEAAILHAETLPVYDDADWVVVLGAQVRGVEPSPMLQRRIDKAVEYARSHPDVRIVVCGGRGEDEGASEASVMASVMTDAGVEEGRLILEDRSVNTRQNLSFAKELIGEDHPRAVIVSDGFHLYRASLLAKELGYDASTLACEKSESLFGEIFYRIREFFGVAAYTFGAA